MSAISLRGVGKRYGDITALHPIDLDIASGERVTLVGHNGSGKTTMIRILSGMVEASTGTATIGGHPPDSLPARAGVSYLADQPIFYDDLSLLEHLEYIARLHGVAEWREDADELIGRLGLSDRADELPGTFSRGLKQKAAICLAFVRPFDVLVVDEPFVGLDRSGRGVLLALFDEVHRSGRTLLVATHELETAAAGGRVVALRDGQLVHDGPADTDIESLVERW